ncbi:hypothetical protein AXF13_07975 [Desulfovibrio fairfieldensis]|uniref:Uncharacterized protein n=1 Tax=Desulfovibrio fairfieldensis TaxID=44742 RepID=A0A0X8JJR8_9BACT|nr:hypothetical protein AXF13_07975 [Desulfovibrio fairfieldensis]
MRRIFCICRFLIIAFFKRRPPNHFFKNLFVQMNPYGGSRMLFLGNDGHAARSEFKVIRVYGRKVIFGQVRPGILKARLPYIWRIFLKVAISE